MEKFAPPVYFFILEMDIKNIVCRLSLILRPCKSLVHTIHSSGYLLRDEENNHIIEAVLSLKYLNVKRKKLLKNVLRSVRGNFFTLYVALGVPQGSSKEPVSI